MSEKSSSLSLFDAAVEFSYEYGVSPPSSKFIGEWWKRALGEMDEEGIRFLYENNFCNNAPVKFKVVNNMRKMLEDRFAELNNPPVNLQL